MNRILSLLLLFSCACNSHNEKQENEISNQINEKSSVTTFPDLEGCYISIYKNDSAFLKINKENNLITGNLSYKHFEKDNNTGTIDGKVSDNLIIADYTFQSEGMKSVRQVVFKISGNNLLEGNGDIIISKNNDSVKFKNISQLNFKNDHPFIKEGCK